MKKVIVLAGLCAAAFGAWKFFSGGEDPAIDTYGSQAETPAFNPEPQAFNPEPQAFNPEPQAPEDTAW